MSNLFRSITESLSQAATGISNSLQSSWSLVDQEKLQDEVDRLSKTKGIHIIAVLRLDGTFLAKTANCDASLDIRKNLVGNFQRVLNLKSGSEIGRTHLYGGNKREYDVKGVEWDKGHVTPLLHATEVSNTDNGTYLLLVNGLLVAARYLNKETSGARKVVFELADTLKNPSKAG